ncbi:response regulator [Paenibacillus sp. JCM 10914]|uniref:response regulator n=1 Tax=Paenibacillus sp. JCM 10914 TaxID=1236974 RepID=UPI0003CCB866|nr:response regulator [Paenibacillus sp. JCM 10914]GAE06046.1 hypothetical protein JCM10914_2186 [Paenibacillus sp. JCM 10914]
MYNVLIADDEIEVREGLKLKVDWEEIGFRITGEASNGLEARVYWLHGGMICSLRI